MKKVLSQFTVFCVACTLMSASAQSGSQSSGSRSSDLSNPNSSSSQSAQSDELSATGRTSGQQSVRATQLMGAEVKDSSGDRIGRLQDVILNPSSGKVDFAVISLSGMGSSSSPSGSSSGSSSGARDQSTGSSAGMNPGGQNNSGGTASDSSSSSGSSAGKLIPIPWSLLQPSSSSSSSSSSLSSGQPSFTLAVSRSKLEQAPSLTSSSWAEISQSSWRQRIFSHFGVSDTSTGGASSPSGSDQGSGSSGAGSQPPQ